MFPNFQSSEGMQKIKDVRASFEKLWDDHMDTFLQDRKDRYPTQNPNSAEVLEFFNYYLTSYMEPCGWIGQLHRYNWDTNVYPVPTSLGSYVQAVDFIPHKMLLKVVLLKEEEAKIGKLNYKPEDIFDVYCWKIVPLHPLPGVQLNFHTLQNAMKFYRLFREEWLMPHHSLSPASEWFDVELPEVKRYFQEFLEPENMKIVGGLEVQQQMLKLWMKLKKLEEAKLAIELKLLTEEENSNIDDGIINENDIAQLYKLNSEIDLLKPAFDQISDLNTRFVTIVYNRKKIESIRTVDYIIVIATGSKLSCGMLDRMRTFIREDLIKKGDKRNADEIELEVHNSLPMVLFSCKPGSTVLLGPGVFHLTSFESFEHGGTLIGFPTPDTSVTVSCWEPGNVWLKGGWEQPIMQQANALIKQEHYNLMIENVKLMLPPQRRHSIFSLIILQNSIKLTLKNCVVINKETLEETEPGITPIGIRGIEVVGDGIYELINTTFTGFTDFQD